MRAVSRSLIALFVAAAAAAAAFAHFAIDIVGDYALPHDTYDDVAHGSRELLTGIAIVVAAVVAVHGLRICCELGASHRRRLLKPAIAWIAGLPFVGGTTLLACAAVPAMEFLDARLAGARLDGLDDAFGGSMLLGLGVTLVCSAIVAFAIFAVARWLVSHRDAIATIIVSLAARSRGLRPSAQRLRRLCTTPRRRRTAHALRLCKRGPPSVARSTSQHFTHELQGDPCAFFFSSRVASIARDRDPLFYCRAGERGTPIGLAR